jgi:glycosyltransferase involved in cell wall biosynthesis
VGGEFGDGSHGRELRALTESLGLDGKVKFLGHSSEVGAFMRRCSLLAVPSRIEAFGMVAIEAMLSGKPVVACRTGGLKEIVSHRETGSLVEAGNVAEMANAIVEILSDKPLALAMGRAGQARVEKRFSLHAMTASFAQFYRMLLKTT